jgi:hypothetical protein
MNPDGLALHIGEPFDLAMRLHLHGDVLAGCANAAGSFERNGWWVYYCVKLDPPDTGSIPSHRGGGFDHAQVRQNRRALL